MPQYMKHEQPPMYTFHAGHEEFPSMHNNDAASRNDSPEAPSIERGNKLLSFQPTTTNTNVLDYSMKHSSLSISSQLHGMFFLSESSRAALTGDTSTPAELTCYRRNLFQISGSVTMPRMLQYAVTEEGERLPITQQELTISATESVEGSAVKIISVPWKTPIAGTPAPPAEEKSEKEPTNITLDPATSHDIDSEYTVFPIAWKRLQFRVATANNGRRRELQQHFTIKLSVTATLSNGSKVSLCDALSGPIIVRGRSPRNFQQRKDVPLSGSGASMRKSISALPAIRHSSTIDSVRRREGSEYSFSMSPPTGDLAAPQASYNDWRGSPAISEHGFPMTPQRSLPGTAPVSPYTGPMPELSLSRTPSMKRKSPEPSGPHLSVPGMRGSSVPPSSLHERPMKMPRNRGSTFNGPPSYSTSVGSVSPHGPSQPTSYPMTTSYSMPGYPKTVGTEAELVTEYFPMGMDHWDPHGQDSVYRPHVLQPSRTLPTMSVGGAPHQWSHEG